MADLNAKAFADYKKLPEVTDDMKQWDGTVDHLIYWAQHEIDLVEEGEREDCPMPKVNERKIRAFIKKWSAAIAVPA